MKLRHIALVVPDVREAEAYYRTIFAADLVGRETRLLDGLWYTIRPDDAERTSSAGIVVGMVALRKDDMVLALFAGEEVAAPLFVGLSMDPAEILLLRSRLPEGTEVTADEPAKLDFRDRYGVRWQITDGANTFRTSGEISGRWLELP